MRLKIITTSVLLAATLVPAETSSAEDAPVGGRFSRAVLIRLEGPITRLRREYLFRSLDKAREHGADLVIVEIDSPGGLLDDSLAMAHRLRDLDWARTVAYVPREALSGAAIAALGCDEIVMHPLAVIGDAGPIYLAEGAMFRHVPEKFRTDLVRKVRDLAEAKSRPPALAEAMVDKDLVVYRVKDKTTGNEAFMSEREIEASNDPDQWEKLNPVLESREGHFLEVNGQRAVELHLARATVRDREELKRRYGLDDFVLTITPGRIDVAVYVLNLPIVTGLLLVVGMIALYFEIAAPGISIGGLTAGLCFAIFFWSRFLGGTAGWLEVVLFVAGVAFIAVELFLIPGFGVAGLSGIALIVSSLVLASQDFLVPHNAQQMQTFGKTLLVVVGSGVAFAILAVALTSYMGQLPILGRLALKPPTSAGDVGRVDSPNAAGDAGTAETPANRFGINVGDVGVAESPLRPAGRAIFGENYVDVVTDGSFVDKGSQVRVIQVAGNRVVVRTAD